MASRVPSESGSHQLVEDTDSDEAFEIEFADASASSGGLSSQKTKSYRVPLDTKVDSFGKNAAEERDLGSGGQWRAYYQRERRDEATSSLLDKRSNKSGSVGSSSADFDPEGSEDYRRQYIFWLRHPRVRENWKTVTAAFLLFSAGIVFLIAGIALSVIPDHDGPKAFIFFICAGICLIPGGYHIIYIYRATKGERGYSFESIPSFR